MNTDTFEAVLNYPGVRTAWLNVLATCPDDAATTRTAFLGGVIGGMEYAKTVIAQVQS